MRVLFILRGCPGSGKSSLISDFFLKDLTIGFDQMRALFSPPVPCADGPEIGLTRRFTGAANEAILTATLAALRARLGAGHTTFFDATNVKLGDQRRLVDIAGEYGYAVYLVDIQGDLTLEEAHQRNLTRPAADRIDSDVLTHLWALGADKTNVVPGVPVISRQELSGVLFQVGKVPRITVAKDIVVVGDVHSCAQALRAALAELDTPDRHWVFLGDLFDRGPDPVGVWNIVADLLAQGRATVLTGNHERNLRIVNGSQPPAALHNTMVTARTLSEAGITAEQQIAFVNATAPAAAIITDGAVPWVATHGGVDSVTAESIRSGNIATAAETTCLYGLGSRAKTYNATGDYELAALPLAEYQFHGHRDGTDRRGLREAVPAVDDLHRVCLEAGAGDGGSVRVAVLTKTDQVTIYNYDDGCQARPLPVPDTGVRHNLLELLEASPLINLRPVEGFEDLVSANFTRQAFRDNDWNELTVTARGLFIRPSDGAILARGYEKFFHLDQAPGRTLDAWGNDAITTYPVIARKKYNGFLALVTSINDELAVFTKAGVTTYSQYAKDMLITALGLDGAEQLRDMLARTNTTATFEVITTKDPHPITEPLGEGLVLLDVIINQERFATKPEIAVGISRRFGLPLAETVDRANTPEQLPELIARAQRRSDEGVVLVDNRGYRGKIKADEYAYRKSLRTALSRIISGKDDHLPRAHAELETLLIQRGLWEQLNQFLVTGLHGQSELDLATLFDTLGARP